MNALKAIVLTIPILPGLKHVIFENNNLQDEFAPLVLFSCFMHPDVNKITIQGNYLRSSFAATYYELMTRFPKKLHELSLQGSVAVPDHMDAITYEN